PHPCARLRPSRGGIPRALPGRQRAKPLRPAAGRRRRRPERRATAASVLARGSPEPRRHDSLHCAFARRQYLRVQRIQGLAYKVAANSDCLSFGTTRFRNENILPKDCVHKTNPQLNVPDMRTPGNLAAARRLALTTVNPLQINAVVVTRS